MVAVEALEPDARLMLAFGKATPPASRCFWNATAGSGDSLPLPDGQNQAVAEELAQEAFLRVYGARARYEPTARFTTWLFRIATHLALNSLRDRAPGSTTRAR